VSNKTEVLNRYFIVGLWAFDGCFIGLWLVGCIWSITIVHGLDTAVWKGNALPSFSNHDALLSTWPLLICIVSRSYATAAFSDVMLSNFQEISKFRVNLKDLNFLLRL
jgi:hypothetical protein